MTIIVEDGSGVDGANAYSSVDEVTAYLSDRNRKTENGWGSASAGAKEAAIIAGTDFVESRFKNRFKGVKKWRNLSEARSVLSLAVNPLVDETVTLGSTVYTFKSTTPGENEVLIGSSTTKSLLNLLVATTSNSDVNVLQFFNNSALVIARTPGPAGNAISTTTTVTGAVFSFSTTRGGNDDGRSQPLSFPRTGMYSSDGNTISNIPARLKQAVAEYAVRAVVSVLQSDVTPDDSGRVVVNIKEKVGPIETATEFSSSGSIQLARYPAADSLLSEFLKESGGVIR